MNATLQSVIDAGLAELKRDTATPTEPLGYGTDISCGTDVDPTLALVDPMSTDGLAQSLIRRWDCPRGMLPNDGKDARDYGLSLRSYVNSGVTRRDLNALQGRLEAEALKDPRFDSVQVKADVAFVGAVASIAVAVRVRPKAPSTPFSLVLAVSSASIVIDSIAAVTA